MYVRNEGHSLELCSFIKEVQEFVVCTIKVNFMFLWINIVHVLNIPCERCFL